MLRYLHKLLNRNADIQAQDLAYFGEDGKAVFMPEPDQPAVKVCGTVYKTAIADYLLSRELRFSGLTEAGSLMCRCLVRIRPLAKLKNIDSRDDVKQNTLRLSVETRYPCL